jgi:drug/metabolite transporter (DMT)-like permease
VRGFALVLAAAFLAGLGVVIGSQMSTEAMGVVVGVVLGVAASAAVTLLLVLVRPNIPHKPTDNPTTIILVRDTRGRYVGEIVDGEVVPYQITDGGRN